MKDSTASIFVCQMIFKGCFQVKSCYDWERNANYYQFCREVERLWPLQRSSVTFQISAARPNPRTSATYSSLEGWHIFRENHQEFAFIILCVSGYQTPIPNVPRPIVASFRKSVSAKPSLVMTLCLTQTDHFVWKYRGKTVYV